MIIAFYRGVLWACGGRILANQHYYDKVSWYNGTYCFIELLSNLLSSVVLQVQKGE